MTNESDAKKAIYDQDCQQYRFLDTLKWGRFQTATAVEGAMIYGLYQTQILLRGLEFRALALLGTLLVLLLCLLSIKDQNDAVGHLKRIAHFEQAAKNPFPARWKGFGHVLMCVAIALINAFNLALVVRIFSLH